MSSWIVKAVDSACSVKQTNHLNGDNPDFTTVAETSRNQDSKDTDSAYSALPAKSHKSEVVDSACTAKSTNHLNGLNKDIPDSTTGAVAITNPDSKDTDSAYSALPAESHKSEAVDSACSVKHLYLWTSLIDNTQPATLLYTRDMCVINHLF